ncbi:MAG: Ref family recombination enhancement nuclease [Telluria sp.]
MKRSAPIKRGAPLKRSASLQRTALRGDFVRRSKKSREKRPSKLPPELRARRRPAASAAEKAYMARVAAFGCVLCRLVFGLFGVPAHVHHLKAGGGSLRASHYDTMPLCPEHHIGSTGIHMLGQRRFEQMYGLSETALLAYFKYKLGVAHG